LGLKIQLNSKNWFWKEKLIAFFQNKIKRRSQLSLRKGYLFFLHLQSFFVIIFGEGAVIGQILAISRARVWQQMVSLTMEGQP
jgi:hypothetical protein